MSASALATFSVLILLLPLTGAVVAGGLGRWLRDRSHWASMVGVGGAAMVSFVVLRHVLGVDADHRHLHVVLYQWISTGVEASWFNVEVLIDPLTAIMLVTVTFISLLVVIYSRDYMREHGRAEPGYERFFAFLALFVFSMCALVLAGNFLLLYLGWELVGLCSYLLIGFYYKRPSAAAAAKKAFLVNRIGDFGFGLGILLIYMTFGRLDYPGVFEMVEQGVTATGQALPEGRLAIIALMLLCGAVGKSAQLPLYVWLPDAMEGPSPVSALIHAATMVTAGVYMVARCGAIFAASPAVMMVVAIIGAATALFAATIALAQFDMKRILAYSTISQLGYMFLGLGVYAAGSAVFHLFTHAFFKALLFLSAGSVMHAMGGVIDLRKFGGLRRVLPWTYRLCLIGALALAGFPFLSGFWSKDEIIHHAFAANFWLGLVGLLTAVLTAFYTFRMIFKAFWGDERIPEGVHAHESGRWMLLPMGVLAVGALLAGYFNVPGDRIGHFLDPVLHPFHAAHAAMAEGAGHAVAVQGFWGEYGL
ncbi:MAG: NADH-quinone oxidoreductase subunit L, partial [Phycisphaerae bacterium]